MRFFREEQKAKGKGFIGSFTDHS